MTRRLARFRRHLHWWTAALVTLGFAIAWIMTALPVVDLLLKFLLYQAHKTIGLTVVGLAALRLWLAYRSGNPPRGVPAVLYGLLLVVPALGYLTAAAAPTDVPTLFLLILPIPHIIAPDAAVFDVIRPMHEWLAIGLIGFAAWHAARMIFTSGSGPVRMAPSSDAHPPPEPD
jgi:cytochrome b561